MNFSELNLLPALAKALAARGYETATGVQAAVLDPAVAGRDLLVSSQTGSGKTIAFGVIVAETLLGVPGAEAGTPPPAPMPAYGKSRGEPAALVIVPTRELATQVRGELAWLLADTRLRLASFTGGTPVSGDLRTLERGVDVVIGTPGRLVDLLRRERLPLGGLKAVVLDEADEMLDLGFREDLETILKAAPAERRTLLLSATIPPEIRAMAKRFQRDAVAIDPRRSQAGGAAPSQAHDDISYVAHLVSGGDRLGAVVNVLRASDSERAIVFVTTREAVADLHAALVARGFAATAISGDRAQAERDRALDQLRRGEVRILVATNVAARGLHLPDVDLIVHADLPLNAESLTHRSGRTGRAGRKGTAVLISTMAERRKAERLLMSAHVKPVWTPLPSREAIAAAARERLATELLAPVVGDEPALAEGADALALRLEAELPAPALIRRLLGRELARLPSGEAVQSVAAPRLEAERGFGGRDAGFGGRNERPHPRERAELSREAVLFRVNIGAKDNADPRWMLPLICRRGGVTRREVGAIRVGPHETTFEIAGHAAPEFTEAAAELDPRARHVVISRADAGPAAPTAAPEQAPSHRDKHQDKHQAAFAPHASTHEHAPPKRRAAFTPQAPGPEHAPKRSDGFAPFSPARDKRPAQAEPGHSVKPEPHPASVHPAKPHAGAKPRPPAKPFLGAKPYPSAKPHTHAKPSYVKPSYMKASHAKPHPTTRPKDKHRKG